MEDDEGEVLLLGLVIRYAAGVADHVRWNAEQRDYLCTLVLGLEELRILGRDADDLILPVTGEDRDRALILTALGALLGLLHLYFLRGRQGSSAGEDAARISALRLSLAETLHGGLIQSQLGFNPRGPCGPRLRAR